MHDLALNPLEVKVFELLLAGDDPVLNELNQQFQSARIRSRRCTGVGYYLYFDVEKKQENLVESLHIKSLFCFGDVDVILEKGKDQQEVGYLLWIKDGYIDNLEAYTFGAEEWPEEIDEFRVKYISGQRNLDELRKEWKTKAI